MIRLATLLSLCLALAACRQPQPLPVLSVGGDFTLTDQNGQPFQSSSLRGQVVLVFFGYTFCPDVCPTTLSKLSAVTRRLGTDAARVKTVYITVDPARDTPAVMREHLGLFRVDAVGLTGSDAAIAQVAQQFGAAYEIEPTDSEAGYLVAHTTMLYGIDPEGRTRILFRYEAPVDEIVDGIRAML
ncbi:MAG: SCO family protein [Acidobacteria bacterium]|nr:SCO family protein [Acidobacteriota bacterium]